ncbi:MAG TPA: UDP-2,3-diacylglucosamine diphosphatase [Burkholderiales bacterium]|nr:UDP-2,3-diacylglucosamine diphosphatase [Burkholderiales bacterium]
MTRALFISDLHLSAERPEKLDLFFRFLDAEARRADALYILGDLFEYWVGDDELSDPQGDALARRVADGLSALAGNGAQVSLMHGNRDFLLASGFCQASGARLIDDPALVVLNGGKTLLMHGDTLCTDDHDYQAWRRIARSADWQRDFLAKSLADRHEAIHDLRARSKEVIAAKPAEIMDVNRDAVKDVFRRHGVRRLIHGHTHRPARHELEIDGTVCERWVLPDWYGPGGYLALDDVGPRLVAF